MKINIKALVLGLGAMTMLSACTTNDIINEIVDPGQQVPNAYWEVGSSAAKAGESFSFQGKYTVAPGKNIKYSEVWYRVRRAETAAATVKLAGSSLNFTKTYTANDTMRAYQPIARFDHSQAEWNGYEFVVKGNVNVSRTLSPVMWVEPGQWDQDRFSQYYPAGFAEDFCKEVITLLTKDNSYYAALRTVYINYPFTIDQFKAVNAKYNVALPTEFDATDGGAAAKSDLWFSSQEVTAANTVGYYYLTPGADGKPVANEVAMDKVTVNGKDVMYGEHKCYPVLKSAPWLFCRYSDDMGAIVTSVRDNYMPAFAELLQAITFQEWIFDSAANVYKVEFSRKYSLESQFRVYDTDGEEGVAADIREISVN